MKEDLGVLARAVDEATPDVETVAKALGEDNLRGDPEGKWRVDAVNRDGSPDPKKAHLLRELYKDQERAEARLNSALRDRVSVGDIKYMTWVEYHARTQRMSRGEQARFDERLREDNVAVLPKGVE